MGIDKQGRMDVRLASSMAALDEKSRLVVCLFLSPECDELSCEERILASCVDSAAFLRDWLCAGVWANPGDLRRGGAMCGTLPMFAATRRLERARALDEISVSRRIDDPLRLSAKRRAMLSSPAGFLRQILTIDGRLPSVTSVATVSSVVPLLVPPVAPPALFLLPVLIMAAGAAFEYFSPGSRMSGAVCQSTYGRGWEGRMEGDCSREIWAAAGLPPEGMTPADLAAGRHPVASRSEFIANHGDDAEDSVDPGFLRSRIEALSVDRAAPAPAGPVAERAVSL